MCVFMYEFGTQPDDHGLIEDLAVVRVLRQGTEAVHFTSSALEEGREVRLKVDWERRFDHMQQHSGAHAAHTHTHFTAGN